MRDQVREQTYNYIVNVQAKLIFKIESRQRSLSIGNFVVTLVGAENDFSLDKKR